MNNNNMTYEEMADIAQEIIFDDEQSLDDVEEALNPVEGTKEFIDLYDNMLSLLGGLKASVMQAQKSKGRGVGDGKFTKAYNSARKLENEIKMVNKVTVDFLKDMKEFMSDNDMAINQESVNEDSDEVRSMTMTDAEEEGSLTYRMTFHVGVNLTSLLDYFKSEPEEDIADLVWDKFSDKENFEKEMFREIRKLAPVENVSVDLNLVSDIRTYSSLESLAAKLANVQMDIDVAVEMLIPSTMKTAIESAVEKKIINKVQNAI